MKRLGASCFILFLLCCSLVPAVAGIGVRVDVFYDASSLESRIFMQNQLVPAYEKQSQAFEQLKYLPVVFEDPPAMLLGGSRQIGPRQIGPRQIGPRQIGPLADLAANWAPHFFYGPICHFLANRAPADWAPWRQIGPR